MSLKLPSINIPSLNLPKVNLTPSNSAINAGIIMEAIAPGTGVGSSIAVQQNGGFFNNLGNSVNSFFSGIGKGGGLFGASKSNTQLQLPSDQQKPDYTLYYALGAMILFIVVVVLVRAKHK